jgi:PAS domain-containing protein
MPQSHALPLIMMRELADNLATPVFLVDAHGTLVYYNEAAEKILGLRYADAGSLSAEEWGARWGAEDMNGDPLPPDARPLAMALNQQRPCHKPMLLLGSDGNRRPIEVTAFPLLAFEDEIVGAVAIFWDRGDGDG